MNFRRIGKRCAIVAVAVGFGMSLSPSAGWSQQQEAEQDVQVAVGPNREQAQPAQPAPRWNDVRVVRVKGDRVGEFEDLIKELTAALAQANLPPIEIWQTVIGEQNTYHVVSPMASLAEFDRPEQLPMEPAAWTSWVSRVEGCIESQERVIAEMQPELSIQPEQAPQPPLPELWMLRTRQVLPGFSDEYEQWFRGELLPALRQSGVEMMFVNRIVLGADERTWVTVTPIENWAALDRPALAATLGEQQADELISRGDAMIERRSNTVLRMRPDLTGAEQPSPNGAPRPNVVPAPPEERPNEAPAPPEERPNAAPVPPEERPNVAPAPPEERPNVAPAPPEDAGVTRERPPG